MLDSVLEAGGADPGAVERVTIGFDAVAALAAGKVDAATAFWNAEGVTLRGLGVPTREFRVDDFGAPRLPGAGADDHRRDAARRNRGWSMPWSRRPARATTTWSPTRRRRSTTCSPRCPASIGPSRRAQLDALIDADALGPGLDFDRRPLEAWSAWEAATGLVDSPPPVARTFALDG